jgi:hypothetical protein
MLALFDYLPSQNAYKVRLLLSHLDLPYQTELVSIFEGEGETESYRDINPSGAGRGGAGRGGPCASTTGVVSWSRMPF